jgi:hypothetical protein
VAVRAGDYLQITVLDRDLQEGTKDLIGGNLHKLTDDELASGVIEIQGFDQVLLLQLTAKQVVRHELLYTPGRYRVTIHNASISAVKPAGVVNAGKAWDILGGLPDPSGVATIGNVSVPLPKIQDTLTPTWAVTAEIDREPNEQIVAAAAKLSVGLHADLDHERGFGVQQQPGVRTRRNVHEHDAAVRECHAELGAADDLRQRDLDWHDTGLLLAL